LINSKFLASELPFHGWKSPEIAWGEIERERERDRERKKERKKLSFLLFSSLREREKERRISPCAISGLFQP
jgi:hypothetical protein